MLSMNLFILLLALLRIIETYLKWNEKNGLKSFILAIK